MKEGKGVPERGGQRGFWGFSDDTMAKDHRNHWSGQWLRCFRETFTPWELGLGTASHTRKREAVFLLKSKKGLLSQRRNQMSLKLRQSFGRIVTLLGSLSYGGLENWFIKATVMAKREAWRCVDYQAAVTMVWRSGREWVDGEVAAQGRERKKNEGTFGTLNENYNMNCNLYYQ